MGPIEEIGLLKMDFLGSRNLDVIEAVDIVEQSTGERPDMATLPLDDPRTYEMLTRGASVGVFQFESDGMRDALARKVRQRRSTTSWRSWRSTAPAPCATSTATRRTSACRTGPVHRPRLRAITESTYGVILYQEQSMEIAKTIAGFSGPEADDLRKAIGKKLREKMAACATASSRAPAPRAQTSA